MKRTTTTTIAALVVVAVAVGAALPALAQDRGPGGPRDGIASRDGDGPGMKRHIERRGPGGSFLALNCGPNAGDRLAHMLLSLEQRTDPAGEQVALFDAFKSAATAAQEDFAASCPTPPAEGDTAERNLIDNLTTRLQLDQARVAAIEEVLPSFTAFYASLSDEQKLALEPRRDDHNRGGRRPHRGGQGMDAPAPAPMNG
jgi:hypothetical protein